MERIAYGSLKLSKECPACFWWQVKKGIRRLNPWQSNLPNVVEKHILDVFEDYRNSKKLPPELDIPELKGLFDGASLRVPVIVGSISDFTFLLKRKTTIEEINSVIKEAAGQPRWKGILTWSEEPLVSSDIIGNPASAIVDLSLTQVVDVDLVKVFGWYDNEYGYSNRLVEQLLNVS